MSEDTNLSSTPAVAMGFSRRTIAILLAGIVGLTTAFLILTGGSAGTIAHAQTTVNVKAGSLTDHECDATEWHFVITQIDSAANAPATITVTWANGRQADVPLSKFTGGVAHYTTTSNLDSTVTDATAVALRRMVGPVQPEPRSMWADDAADDAADVALGKSDHVAIVKSAPRSSMARGGSHFQP